MGTAILIVNVVLSFRQGEKDEHIVQGRFDPQSVFMMNGRGECSNLSILF